VEILIREGKQDLESSGRERVEFSFGHR
jgi:hypothetical protein